METAEPSNEFGFVIIAKSPDGDAGRIQGLTRAEARIILDEASAPIKSIPAHSVFNFLLIVRMPRGGRRRPARDSGRVQKQIVYNCNICAFSLDIFPAAV